MAHYALINASGNVVNVIAWDGASEWTPPEGLTAVLDATNTVSPGWTYANGAFVAPPAPPPPPPPVPSCQLWQLQAVMTPAQWVAAQAAVTALNNVAVSAFFAHGTNVIPANSTTLIALGEAIGLTSAQITALVTEASAVSIP